MRTTGRRPAISNAVLLLVLLLVPVSALAADHVVSPAELHRSIARASEIREQNVEKVQAFFRQDSVRAALKSTRINERKIVDAVPTLSDSEVARLAQSTDKVQQDFAAGSLTNEQLTYVVIALATAVIVILIVEH